MANRVFLHIGASKTGTTYLQGLLHANRTALADHGLLFPSPLLDHFRFMLSVLDRLDDLPRVKAAHTAYDRVVEAIREWDGDALVSNELLAAATPEQVARVVADVAPAEVHVIYTVRDLARTLPAEWQQAVKGGYPEPLEEFLAQVMATFDTLPESVPVVVGESEVVPKFARLHRLDDVMARWATSVPEHRLHVVTLPPEGAAPGLLWERFSSVVGVDPAVASKPPRRSNESLGVPEAELLRRVNGVLEERGRHDFPEREWVRNHLVLPILMPRPAGAKIAIPAEAHAWAVSRAEQIADHLAASDYDVVGDARDLVPPAAPRPGILPEDVEERGVSDAAVEAIAVLVRELREATRKPARAGSRPPASSQPSPQHTKSRLRRLLGR